MDKRTILLNLQHHAKWLKDQTQSTVNGGYLAANVMVGCVQIINCCGQSIRQWVDLDNGRRKLLGHIQESYATQRGRRVLSKLVALTIAAVQASSWVDDFGADALPVQREPARRSDAHIRAMQEGKRRARERRGESPKRSP
jgi:hypothetical protein